ncbi:hypothetical protein HDU97_007786 [Phlyctochytrium planicorne]|nr:hypothetical protein HDU97_007786 [Phlyctochytrium planicorne]
MQIFSTLILTIVASSSAFAANYPAVTPAPGAPAINDAKFQANILLDKLFGGSPFAQAKPSTPISTQNSDDIFGVKCPASSQDAIESCLLSAVLVFFSLPADCQKSLSVTPGAATTTTADFASSPPLPACACPVAKAFQQCVITSCPEANKALVNKAPYCFPSNDASFRSAGGTSNESFSLLMPKMQIISSLIFTGSILLTTSLVSADPAPTPAPEAVVPNAGNFINNLVSKFRGGALVAQAKTSTFTATSSSTVFGVPCPADVTPCIFAAAFTFLALPADCQKSLSSVSPATTTLPTSTLSDDFQLPANFPTCTCPVFKAVQQCVVTACPEANKVLVNKAAICFPSNDASGRKAGWPWMGAVAGGLAYASAAGVV